MRGKIFASLLAGLSVGGCGFAVPEIQDFPATPQDGQLLVQAIVTSVHCEIANAVKQLIDADLDLSRQHHQPRFAAFLDKWGVQVSLTLTMMENSSLSPNAVWLPPSPPSSIFTLGAGLNGSAEATRTDSLNFYYTIADLYKRGYCSTGVQMGNAHSLLLRSDLKLKEWLFAQVGPVATGEIVPPTDPGGPLQRNAFAHEVKFVVHTGGSLNPAWTLANATINQSGNLFETNRDRTHDLTITFGPDNSGKGLQLPAANEHLAKQIGLAVSTNLRNVTVPVR
jgi:hypothetical protein